MSAPIIRISQAEARNMVLQNMRAQQLQMSRAGREYKTYWGLWSGKPIYLTIGQAIAEVEANGELGQTIVAVLLGGIAQQTGVTYVVQ